MNPKIHEILEVCAFSRGWTGADHWIVQKTYPENIKTASVDALRINGYTIDKWRGAKSWVEFGGELYEKLIFRPICGHNVQFDIAFLKETFRRLGLNTTENFIGREFIDTKNIAERVLMPKGLKKRSLSEVCTFLGISTEGAHHALNDVAMVVAAYDRMYDDWRKYVCSNSF